MARHRTSPPSWDIERSIERQNRRGWRAVGVLAAIGALAMTEGVVITNHSAASRHHPPVTVTFPPPETTAVATTTPITVESVAAKEAVKTQTDLVVEGLAQQILDLPTAPHRVPGVHATLLPPKDGKVKYAYTGHPKLHKDQSYNFSITGTPVVGDMPNPADVTHLDLSASTGSVVTFSLAADKDSKTHLWGLTATYSEPIGASVETADVHFTTDPETTPEVELTWDALQSLSTDASNLVSDALNQASIDFIKIPPAVAAP